MLRDSSTRTLRSQLLTGLLLPLGIVALVQFSFAYNSANVTAQGVTDRLLLASARAIAERIQSSDNGLEAIIPPAALGMFDFGYGDTVYYRVTTANGKLLAGYPDLPSPPKPPVESQSVYYDGQYENEAIRLVAVRQPIPRRDGTEEAQVIVAETLNGRNAMWRQLWVGSGTGQLVLVAIACLIVWFALRRALSPILQLGTEVQERKPNDFMPFTVADLQAEFQPLIKALNGYVQRLRTQLEAQRRFTANAAHQLRTPLTLLRTQASYALRSASESERREATQAILSTTRQLTRLTNQLLTLAKAEPRGEAGRREAVDLAGVTREVLEEYGPLAVDRGIDLAFEIEPQTSVPLKADPGELRDLVLNLIDNAIRYTQPGGRVTVKVARDGDECVLRVEDTGPGIPASQRALVFERFYRIPGSDSDGSGLGLAIVREILAAHGGTIALLDRGEHGGLVVEVRLPSSPDVAEGRRPPLQEVALGPR